jgi:hypothetical protein
MRGEHTREPRIVASFSPCAGFVSAVLKEVVQAGIASTGAMRCTIFYAFFMNSDIFVTGGRSRLSVSRMLSLRFRLARASYQQC